MESSPVYQLDKKQVVLCISDLRRKVMYKEIENIAVEGEDPSELVVEPVHNLLTSIGSIVENPIFVEIIDSAAKPSAARSYVELLGWDSDIASRVRKAVQLKNKYGGTWKDIKRSQPPPSSMLEYNEDEYEHLGIDIRTGKEMADYLLISDGKKIPFFLRDFEFIDPNKPGKFNTFDYDHTRKVAVCDENYKGIFSEGIGPRAWSCSYGDGVIEVVPGQSDDEHNKDSPGWGWRLPKSPFTRVFTRWAIIRQENKFPIFGKASSLRHTWGPGAESVELFIREDLGPECEPDRQVAWIEYRRNHEMSTYFDAVLKLRFRFNRNGEIKALSDGDDTEIPLPPGSNFTLAVEHRSDIAPLSELIARHTRPVIHPEKAGEAMQGLLEIAERFMENRRLPFLEKWFHSTLGDQPNSDLASLVV